MRRFHLLELEDQAWWPARWRRYMTDYLVWVEARARLFDGLVPVLAETLERAGASRVVDLCSGSGGPWVGLADRISAAAPGLSEVVLTDLFPSAELAPPAPPLRWEGQPVDARRVPERLVGFRTLWNAFHHFEPGEASAILADAVAAGEGIAVFEVPRRRWRSLLPIAVLVPLAVFLATPWIEPRRLDRLVWTYLLPVLPAAITFDGVVSCLRAYSPPELLALAREADPSARFEWQASELRPQGSPARITYLIGSPRVPLWPSDQRRASRRTKEGLANPAVPQGLS